MKTTEYISIAALALALSVPATNLLAVPNTKLAIRCPDVLLRWPSTSGQSFIVEYRPTLSPETPWAMLTNYYLAATGTNVTSFVHSNQVQCPSGQSFGMMRASGGEESMLGSSAQTTDATPAPLSLFPQSLTQAVLAGEDFYLLDSPPMPPIVFRTNGVLVTIPWEEIYGPLPPILEHISDHLRERVLASIAQYADDPDFASMPATNLSESDGPGSPPGPLDGGGTGGISSGFYRIINVTPKVQTDIFRIEQDSFQNQLDILKNDSDPNEDRFLISTVSLPQHGDVTYTLDGSTFQYTPTNGFYGLDTFTYIITNFHYSYATGYVRVFVNQTGNSAPYASPLTLILETNFYSAVLNALTNTIDPDGDTNILLAITQPRLGGVTTNATADLFYSRNPDFFGRDTFTYLVTDQRGGYAIGETMIVQVDSDGDGMPDEYEARSGLDISSNDSTGDPDGDGVPNLAEFILQTNPNSRDNPFILSVTNGTVLSGFLEIALRWLNPVIELQPISLYANGLPAAHSRLRQGPDGTWFLNWDTTHLTNGAYSVAVGFQYLMEPATGEDGTIFGPTNTVSVTNFARFSELTDQFTDFLLIDAQLIVSNAQYRVDLYDEDGSPLVYTIGTTTNGLIQLYWDLTDGQGTQLAFGSIEATFTLTGSNVPPSLDPIQHWFLKEPGATGGDFVVAWGWDVYSTGFNNRRNQAMLDGVVNLLGNPSIPSYTLKPSANVPYASTYRFDTLEDKDFLLDTLKNANSGNFFWWGHGAKDNFAGNFNKTRIVWEDVSYALQNRAYLSTPRVPRTNAHPYRFVVLNSCNSYSKQWADAFGIDWSPSGSSTLTMEYRSIGRIPRAFVGWTNTIDVPNRLGSWIGYESEYAEGLGELFFNWMEGNWLTYNLTQYANKMAFHGFDGHDSWKISGCANMSRFD